MTANISIVTLGVKDLPVSTVFYEKLGWANTKASQESVTFLQGHSVVLGLYGHEALATDAQIDMTPIGFRGVSVAINLENETAVDAYFEKAIAAGAHPQKKPEKAFWGGYSSYFADPDGHLWEVAYNPFFEGDIATGQLKLEPKA